MREELGERPADARKLEVYNDAVQEIYAYRQRQGISDPNRALGVRPKDTAERTDYRRTEHAIRQAQRLLGLERSRGVERNIGLERGISIEL
jgi:hypothetical protein